MARRALFAILLMRQLFPGEATLQFLEGSILAMFDLANPFSDLCPLGGAQFDLIDLCFNHSPDELPDFAGFAVAFFITDRSERRIFLYRKTKRDALLSHSRPRDAIIVRI